MKKTTLLIFATLLVFIGCAKKPQAPSVFIEPTQYICKKTEITLPSGLKSPIYEDYYAVGSHSLFLNGNNIKVGNPFEMMSTTRGTIKEWDSDYTMPNRYPGGSQVYYIGRTNDIRSNKSYEVFLTKEKKNGIRRGMFKYRVNITITAKDKSAVSLRCKGK